MRPAVKHVDGQFPAVDDFFLSDGVRLDDGAEDGIRRPFVILAEGAEGVVHELGIVLCIDGLPPVFVVVNPEGSQQVSGSDAGVVASEHPWVEPVE